MTETGTLNGLKSREFIDSQDCVGIYEFARVTGYSYWTVYQMVRLGKLRAFKSGPAKTVSYHRGKKGMWLIPKEVLHSVLTQLVAVEDKNAG